MLLRERKIGRPQIAHEIDSVGGQLDAFTSREYTCFYTKTLDSHIPIALEILSDMLYNRVFHLMIWHLKDRRYKRRNPYVEDSPRRILCMTFVIRRVKTTHTYGQNDSRQYESLDSITPDIMRNYMNNHYTSANTIISVSGNFDDTFLNFLKSISVQKKCLTQNRIFPTHLI